jgi:hypothetical protein
MLGEMDKAKGGQPYQAQVSAGSRPQGRRGITLGAALGHCPCRKRHNLERHEPYQTHFRRGHYRSARRLQPASRVHRSRRPRHGASGAVCALCRPRQGLGWADSVPVHTERGRQRLTRARPAIPPLRPGRCCTASCNMRCLSAEPRRVVGPSSTRNNSGADWSNFDLSWHVIPQRTSVALST